jgi:uncharacterized phage protein (TIGR01671 family)
MAYEGFVISPDGEVFWDGGMKIADVELMMSTRVQDKNGRDVFEGDIVRTSREIGVIEFSDAAFVIGIYEEGELQREEIHTEHDAWEVIGNIYETPQLLTV